MKKKVNARLIRWRDKDDVSQLAFKGDLVELPSGEAERLADYLIDPDQEEKRNGTLTETSGDATTEETRAWVSSAKVGEIEAKLEGEPDQAAAIFAAETSSGKPRPGVIKAVYAALAAGSGDTLVAWVKDASLDQVSELLGFAPTLADDLLEAESVAHAGDSRPGFTEAVQAAVAATQ